MLFIKLKRKGTWLGAFKRATMHHHSPRGCKTVTCHIWMSEKIALGIQGEIFLLPSYVYKIKTTQIELP